MASLKFVLYALLFILFLIFIVQNYTTLTAPHSLHLNLALANLETVPLPFYILALILFFMGFFLALLLGALPKQRLKRELRDCRQQKKDLEKKWQDQIKADQQTLQPPASAATPPRDTRKI